MALAPPTYLQAWLEREGPGASLHLADWLGMPTYEADAARYPLLDILGEQIGMDLHTSYIRTVASIRLDDFKSIAPTLNVNILEKGLLEDFICNAKACYDLNKPTPRLPAGVLQETSRAPAPPTKHTETPNMETGQAVTAQNMSQDRGVDPEAALDHELAIQKNNSITLPLPTLSTQPEAHPDMTRLTAQECPAEVQCVG